MDNKQDIWKIYWQTFSCFPDKLFLINQQSFIIISSNIDNPTIELINTGIKSQPFKEFIEQSDNNKINLSDSIEIENIKHKELNENEFYLFRLVELSTNDEHDKSEILDIMTDSAALITKEYKILYANKAFKERFNANDTQIEKTPCYKIMYGLDHPCIACNVDTVAKTGKLHRNTRSQKEGPVTLGLTYPVFNKNKQVTGGVVTLRDITESKNIEKALKKEATINRAIADISQAIIMPELSEEKIANKILSVALILTKSSTGYVASVNQTDKTMTWKAYENFSLSSSQMAKNAPCQTDSHINCIFNFIKDSKEVFLSNRLEDFLKEKKLNICKLTRDNALMAPALYNNRLLGQIFVSGSERPYSDYDKELLEHLATIFAITLYRKHSEADLIKARDEAEESNKLKSAFLANMSHEIRTPMNSINGFSELLKNTDQPIDAQKEYVDTIYKSSNQLLNIIDNILDISKLEVGQVDIAEKENDINQIIIDAMTSFNPDLYLESPIEFKTHLPIKGAESIIKCDAPRLQQVLSNLIQNALKFTPKGFIEVGYNLNENNYLQFYVKDTGIGIPPQKLSIIFERFGQAEEGETRNYKGAGLGLPICKGFIELMGGEIWVDSEPGNGSIFNFTIPYKPIAGNLKQRNTKQQETKYNWKSKKILLVEDESFSKNFIQTILLPFGPKILYAEDGIQAIEQVKHNPDIDLILMDIRLPMLDGIEATIRIRKNGFDKPILAQTANAMPEDRKKCLDVGCNEFIVKPIARLDFLKIVNQYLE